MQLTIEHMGYQKVGISCNILIQQKKSSPE